MTTQKNYDVFLSYASEDAEWCEMLAEKLREEGARVWFDKWALKPGHHLLARLNEGLKESRKMIAVWTNNYFRDDKVWTLAESFSQQYPDALAQERLLIPLLREDCSVPPTLRNIINIDFRRDEDFALRFRDLIQALDLRREFQDKLFESQNDTLSDTTADKPAPKKGRRFETEVAALYRLLGFDVKLNAKVGDRLVNMAAERKLGGSRIHLIVETKEARITEEEIQRILDRQKWIHDKLPRYRLVALSSVGFDGNAQAVLEEIGVDCVTYDELLHELVPLDEYVKGLITDYKKKINDQWKGQDWFIRPKVSVDITYEQVGAVDHIGKWFGDSRANLLTVLGDLGTGKSTLANFLAYNLANSFLDDPARHPAPVLIPLKEVRKEVSLEGIIINHFSRHGLPGINFSRFNYLIQNGKVILIFDAFDEMADRVRWDITQSNFRELKRAAERDGKVILTCRTHYFKDRDEQVKLIGQGPRLSEVETELYKELRQQSGAEVVYLQEFDDAQIQDYLHKARPQSAEEDWRKIQEIYNLKELAHRPLLLDMIVQSLPKLEAGIPINAANLYKVYTQFWIDREEKDKGRILDKEIKQNLMLELAWRMWQEEKDEIHYHELIPFVEKLIIDKVIEFGDEEIEDIAREMQAATFLKRDDAGNFSFMHRSFMEYFVARKVLGGITSNGDSAGVQEVLNSRRFERKVIYFLTLLDGLDSICKPLQTILTNNYLQYISENALEILYWSGRIRYGMEDRISAPEELRSKLAERIPAFAKLTGANLQEIVLEAANFINADLDHADLTNAKLNHACLSRSILRKTKLTGASIDNAFAELCDFQDAELSGTSFNGAHLEGSNFTGASYQQATFIHAHLQGAKGITESVKLRLERLKPVIQRGQSVAVKAVAFSHDGKFVARGGESGLVFLYHTNNGRLLQLLEGHSSAIRAVSFSPDDKMLASGEDNCSIRIWDVESGYPVMSLEGHTAPVRSLVFSPDGQRLSSGADDKTVRLWDVKSGRQLKVIKSDHDPVVFLSFSPDDNKLVGGDEGGCINIWEVSDGSIVRELLWPHGVVKSVGFSFDGTQIVCSDGNEIRAWNIRSGRLLREFRLHTKYAAVTSINFSPDGRVLAIGEENGGIHLQNLLNENSRTLDGHTDAVLSLAFSPKGDMLASGGSDKSLRIWKLSRGRGVRVLGGDLDSVHALTFSSDGKMVASGSENGGIRIESIIGDHSMRWLKPHSDAIRSMSFSPDGKKLASCDDNGGIRIREVSSGRSLETMEEHSDQVLSVSFSPDGERLASVGDDGKALIWEIKREQDIEEIIRERDWVRAAAISNIWKTLAIGGDKYVRLYGIDGGRLMHVLEGHQGWVLSIAFSADEELVASGSSDKSVGVWKVKSGERVQSFIGHKGSVLSVAFSPNNEILASGGRDGAVRIWHVADGAMLQLLEGHAGEVNAIAFAPNNKFLVAAGTAGRLQFWDHLKGETFLYRYAFGPRAWLDLLPDGRFDASPDGMRYLSYTEQSTLKSYTAEELEKSFYDPAAVRKVLARYVY